MVTHVANKKDVGPDGLQGPLTRGKACGGVVMAPAGKTPKTKGGRRQVERAHEVLPCREEVVRGDVNRDAMQIRHHGREPLTKFTVKGIGGGDEGGDPG